MIQCNVTTITTIEQFEDLVKVLPSLIACDFETGSKYTDKEKIDFKVELDMLLMGTSKHRKTEQARIRFLQNAIASNGLSHPSKAILTHLSIAINEDTAYVVVFVNKILGEVVLDWLVTTEVTQVWHNLTFDGLHILYHTGRLPKKYEDTMIMARIGTNHCDPTSVGLKYLMGDIYGDWAVSKDVFNIDNILDEGLIQYAGIDACATYKLYEEIKESWND